MEVEINRNVENILQKQKQKKTGLEGRSLNQDLKIKKEGIP